MSYSVTLDVSVELVRFVARLLGVERQRIDTLRETRAFTPFRQAAFGLAWLRDRCDVERLGAGFGLSRATAYRYRDEVLRVNIGRKLTPWPPVVVDPDEATRRPRLSRATRSSELVIHEQMQADIAPSEDSLPY